MIKGRNHRQKRMLFTSCKNGIQHPRPSPPLVFHIMILVQIISSFIHHICCIRLSLSCIPTTQYKIGQIIKHPRDRSFMRSTAIFLQNHLSLYLQKAPIAFEPSHNLSRPYWGPTCTSVQLPQAPKTLNFFTTIQIKIPSA